jgi:hypothetical protein
MTREEILAMEPGHKLDALVAEKVMRWTKEGNYWLSHTCRIRTWEQTSYPGFQPSTDISAAWEVVESLRDKWYYLEIRTCADDWVVQTNADRSVRAKTAQEAICKAALIAVTDA